jgi:outer membrane protein assembly factor BamB
VNFRGIAVGAAVALSGCTCRARVEPVNRDDDAMVRDDAHHDATPDRERFVIIGTDVVDLATKKVVHSFSTRPECSALDATTAYVWANHRLAAIDLPSGKNRWAYEDLSTAPVVGDPLVDDRNLYMAWADVVYAFDRATGERKTILAGTSAHAEQMVRFGRSLVVMGGGSLTFVDLEDRSVRSASCVGGGAVLLATEDLALCVGMFDPGPFMHVDAFDDRGGSAWSDVEGHESSAGYAAPDVVRQVTRTHLVASGFYAPVRSIVIGLAKGTVDWDHDGEPIAAIVEDGAGAIDLALVAYPVTHSFAAFDPKTTAARWTVTFPCLVRDIDVAWRGDRVFLAGFNMGDGGGCVVAVDRKDGAVAWTAELTHPPIDHSEYWSNVKIRVRGDELVAIGREAGAEHVDVFALASGDRRFTHVVLF